MDSLDIGSICQESGCQTHDFLPFTCSLCLGNFCLAHRSRFVHTCHAINNTTIKPNNPSSSNPQISVKEMFKSVEQRFEHSGTIAGNHGHSGSIEAVELPSGSSDEHYHIKTSSVRSDQILNPKTEAILQKLKGTNKASSKAQEIIMKSHAKGDVDLEYDKRLYLSCIFPHLSLCLYFNGDITIGEFLSKVASQYPQAAFGTAVKPNNMAMCMHTEDTPDWKIWNHNWQLKEVLSSLEQVYVNPIPIDELVSNQIEHEVEKLQSSEKSESVKSDPIISPADRFKVGEQVMYENSTGVHELVSIVGVHLDDYPNVYYTILPNQLDSATQQRHEKQTYHKRLSRPQVVSQPTTSQLGAGQLPISMGSKLDDSPAFNIQVTHGSRTYLIIDIGKDSKVSELKTLLGGATGIPVSRIKLVCKGSVLKDSWCIADTAVSKVVSGGKITMIGSAAV